MEQFFQGYYVGVVSEIQLSRFDFTEPLRHHYTIFTKPVTLNSKGF